MVQVVAVLQEAQLASSHFKRQTPTEDEYKYPVLHAVQAVGVEQEAQLVS